MKDFPCICRHNREVHPNIGKYYLVCNDCCMKTKRYDMSCKKYQPDNLKYLEQKYEESFKK